MWNRTTFSVPPINYLIIKRLYYISGTFICYSVPLNSLCINLLYNSGTKLKNFW
jgi:hypothetical protein